LNHPLISRWRSGWAPGFGLLMPAWRAVRDRLLWVRALGDVWGWGSDGFPVRSGGTTFTGNRPAWRLEVAPAGLQIRLRGRIGVAGGRLRESRRSFQPLKVTFTEGWRYANELAW